MAFGALVLLPFILIVDSSFIFRDAVFGALSGVFVAMGLAILYRGLAVAPASVIAPISAVVAILLPLGWDLISGASLGGVTIIGCVVAIIALVVVSFDPEQGEGEVRQGITLAVGAGLFFGLTFVFAGTTSQASGAWPAVFNRGFGLVGILVLALRQQVPLMLDSGVRKFGLAGGVAGALGMLSVILGTQIGSLGTVSVIAGSSPAVTVIAAATFDGDRVHWWQGIGVIGSIVGTALIALGS